METLLNVIEIVLPTLFTFILGFLVHKRELKKLNNELETNKQKQLLALASVKEERDIAIKKLEYLPRVMKLANFVEIEKAIDLIFKKTKITRFLIFIGVNGKTSLNHVSCIFYKYKNKEDDIQPFEIYKNVDITNDVFYKSMLKNIEKYAGFLERIDTMKMPKSLLRDIYFDEQITHSRVGFINRKAIDDNNDFIMYYSASTDTDKPNGITEVEENYLRLIVDSKIKPSLENIQR